MNRRWAAGSARRQAVAAPAGAAAEQLIAEYREPWTDPRVCRSWLAMAGAADGFEKVAYAEKFALEIPRTTLVRIPRADHIPTENAPNSGHPERFFHGVEPGSLAWVKLCGKKGLPVSSSRRWSRSRPHRGGPLAFDLDRVVLAQLGAPDAAAMDAQLNELLQPGGERVEPAAEYEARDSSGTVRVVVDAQRKLVDVGIQPSWEARIPAARLAGVLFQTYVTAIQRAMVVELANDRRPSAAHAAEGLPLLDESLPHEEWVAAIRARMDAVDAQLADIHRLDASRTPPAGGEVRSPRGFFVLHLRGGSPAGLAGSVAVLPGAGADRLRLDVLEVFASAGLAAPAAPASRSARRPPEDDDEDVFEFRYDV